MSFGPVSEVIAAEGSDKCRVDGKKYGVSDGKTRFLRATAAIGAFLIPHFATIWPGRFHSAKPT
jgi:hypothetical protein